LVTCIHTSYYVWHKDTDKSLEWVQCGDQCNQKFNSMTAYNKHVHEEHNVEVKPAEYLEALKTVSQVGCWHCPHHGCGMRFDSKEEKEAHCKKHRQVHTCPICNKKLKSLESKKKHMKNVHGL
jgi:hypothetical protein